LIAKNIFIDTSAFYALISKTENNHDKARKIYERLIDTDHALFTSSYILIETASLVQNRLGTNILDTFMYSIEKFIEIVWIDELIHKGALAKLRSEVDAHLSLVDWTTVLIATNLKANIFAFGHDFSQFGIPQLTAT